MENPYPKVSVIIPVYNGELYLAEAIESVLAQEFQPLEIIIIDDGSTDNSATIAQSFQEIIYYFQNNQGVSASRNSGIRIASGELITFLDYDDRMLPNSILSRVSYMIEHPKDECLMTMHQSFLESGVKKPNWVKDIELEEGIFGQGYMMFRKDLFESIGWFNLAYKMGEDTELLFRIREEGHSIGKLAHISIKRRIHNNNLSGNRDVYRKSLLNMTKASVNRKKRNSGKI